MMDQNQEHEITRILQKAGEGDDSALNQLMPLVYDELRALAEHFLKSERPDHTLQATALVHEAYVKLINQDINWQNRAHFFAIASRAIRRILVDHSRSRGRLKRGGDKQRITLQDSTAVTDSQNIDLIALDEALTKLTSLNERQARIVELRFFGGLTLKEVAHCLDVSPRTVDGDWFMARAWLKREIKQGDTIA